MRGSLNRSMKCVFCIGFQFAVIYPKMEDASIKQCSAKLPKFWHMASFGPLRIIRLNCYYCSLLFCELLHARNFCRNSSIVQISHKFQISNYAQEQIHAGILRAIEVCMKSWTRMQSIWCFEGIYICIYYFPTCITRIRWRPKLFWSLEQRQSPRKCREGKCGEENAGSFLGRNLVLVLPIRMYSILKLQINQFLPWKKHWWRSITFDQVTMVLQIISAGELYLCNQTDCDTPLWVF